MHEQLFFFCETVDGGCFAFAPLVGSNLFCQRTSQLGESACHMPISYRFIRLETSAAGLPGNYLYISIKMSQLMLIKTLYAGVEPQLVLIDSEKD